MAVFLPVFTNAPGVSAAIINRTVVLKIDVSSVVEIPVGDKFLISLSFDDSALDTDPSTFGGAFPDALQSYSISRNPENLGTWDAACGTPDLDRDNFVTNANGDSMTIQMLGTGFPAGSPGEFRDVGLVF
ncbi:MAG: hypothetical protein IIC02_12960 [Planctomycetes bacterium]|nr:hypothetical protein [Planctomycetota bacterium]